MLLFEIMSNQYPWTWTERSENDFWQADFQTEEHPYVVSFTYFEDAAGNKWDVEFMPTDMRYPQSTSALGVKSPTKVFSTVVNVIRDFAAKHRQTKLTFSSKEANRTALYSKLLKRLNVPVTVHQGENGSSFSISI